MPKKTTPAPTNEAPATKTEEVVKEAETKERALYAYLKKKYEG